MHKAMCGLISFVSLLMVAPIYGQEERTSPTAELYEMKFVGHVENAELNDLVQSIYREFFADPFERRQGRHYAVHIEIYIASDVIQNTVFVPPTELNFSPEHLAAFEGKHLPNVGCHLRRFWFRNREDYVVVLIDSSEDPEFDVVEACVLGAIATALGEEIEGRQISPNDRMRELIRHIVGER